MLRNVKRGRGFTLVEILIVVVILGILAAIVVPQFTSAANESRVGNIATQVSTLETQLELFAARNNGTYPTIVELNTDNWDILIEDNYLKSAPRNPFTNTSTVTAWADFDAADDSDTAVVYDGAGGGWYYDEDTGNIAAWAPASADPS